MKRNKILIVLLVMALFLSCVPSAFASEPIIISCEQKTAIPGEEVEVGVSIKGNPGITGVVVKLNYDTTVFSFDPETDVTLGDFTTKGLIQSNYTDSGCVVQWYHTSAANNDGIVFFITFTVSKEASLTEYPIDISIGNRDLIDSQQLPLKATCIPGKVTMREPCPKISGANLELSQGETFNYEVSIEDNPGISGYKAFVSFDPNVFSLMLDDEREIDITQQGEFAKGNMKYQLYSNAVVVLWYSALPGDTKADGLLFSIPLKVREHAVSGSYEILVGYYEEDTVNKAEQPVPFEVASGNIEVSQPFNRCMECGRVHIYLAYENTIQEGTSLLCAMYSNNGQMIKIGDIVRKDGVLQVCLDENEFDMCGKVKMFQLDSKTHIPKTDAKEVFIKK